MRYLEENEIDPYISAGKIIEQYLGTFELDDLLCHRFVSIGKSKYGYYGFIIEVFDESKDGVDSIYYFSSVNPDYPEGIEYGPMDSLTELLELINKKILLSCDKYLLSGFLDNIIK